MQLKHARSRSRVRGIVAALSSASLFASLLAGSLAGSARAGEPVCDPDPPCPAENGPVVEIEIQTPLGTIPIELWPQVAPLNVSNLLAYIDRGFYDGTLVHRSVQDPGFKVVQGGFFRTDGSLSDVDPPVCAEDCRPSARGTVSMARGPDPHSATSQWFINVTDNFNLDPPARETGFSVIGRVTGNGMEVVDTINALPTTFGELVFPSPFFRFIGAEIPHAPDSLGCFDTENDLAVLFSSEIGESGNAILDEFGRFVFYSTGCDVEPPPAPECTSPPGCDPQQPGCVEEPGVEVAGGFLELSDFNCQIVGGVSAPCVLSDGSPALEMSCDGAVASENAREAFAGPQTLITANVVRVPEPSGGVLAALATLALAAVRRSRR